MLERAVEKGSISTAGDNTFKMWEIWKKISRKLQNGKKSKLYNSIIN